jgi:bifunctional non-homologous end joining protein LigD
LRNQRGATAIASYSTRARNGAPVATPIAWDELSAKTRPDMYNVNNLPVRLAKLKKDPWADFFSTRQSLSREVRAAFKK